METVTSADGTTIAFDRLVGPDPAAPPVVLLPGATCTHGVLDELAAALAAHVTVLNVDRRGRGESDDRADPPPYEVAREVEDVAAVVEAAGDAAALYGHSSGAGLALQAAAAGVPVTGLVLHDAPYTVAGGDPTDAQTYARMLHEYLDEGHLADALILFLAGVGLPREMIDGMAQGPGWAGLVAIAPTLAYDSAAMGDATGGFVPVDLLPRVTAPTLALVGGADHAFMVDIAHELAACLPDGRVEQLVGHGHDAPAEVVAPAVLAFLRGQGVTGANG